MEDKLSRKTPWVLINSAKSRWSSDCLWLWDLWEVVNSAAWGDRVPSGSSTKPGSRHLVIGQDWKAIWGLFTYFIHLIHQTQSIVALGVFQKAGPLWLSIYNHTFLLAYYNVVSRVWTQPASVLVYDHKPLSSSESVTPFAPSGAFIIEQSRCPLQCCGSVLSMNCWKNLTREWVIPAYCGTAFWGT